ncbi:MAG: KH domain-containing protein [Coriobacteriia bacterium]|nr:KH domain-containing protein [Coriobacteriia bacterium]MCL2537742.1 KH domain-containing protein [Coriobacteriia bacterium]
MSTQTDVASVERVEELVSYIVGGLVDNPEELSIETVLEEGSLRVIIEAGADDVGKIIGRGGRTIKSIRTLARASVGSPSLHVDIDVEG